MSKQNYHKPVLKLYGNISTMTQNTMKNPQAALDGSTGNDKKTS